MHVKLMATTIVAFFIGINIFPLIENINGCNCSDPPCSPELSGTIGENNWYISNVSGTFNDSGNYIYYRIDEGDWIEYVAPFLLNMDGIHFFEWKCDENNSDIYSLEIKIDQTPPTISQFINKRVGFLKWQFTVNASDNTSGINKVEIYIFNGEFIGADTEPPYQGIWAGCMLVVKFLVFLNYWWYGPQALAYDNAGNIAMWAPFS